MSPDLRAVSRYLGLLMLVLSALIFCVGLFAYAERLLGGNAAAPDAHALLITTAVGVVLGGGLSLVGRGANGVLAHREALLVVATSWLVGAALGALPFRLWALLREGTDPTGHCFDSFVNCYFEAMSGFTTTGATVVEALSTLPRSLLLWRSLTHWLGGLGIVVLFVAVLPILGIGGRRVYRIEAPGPTPDGVRPRIQDAARMLWLIYLGLTCVEIIALMLCGMDWFDATCHTFATLATGGFSTRDASIGGFESGAIHAVIIVFMILAGVNFGLYYQLLQRQWRNVLKDPELRAYFMIILVATTIVTISLVRSGPAVGPAGESLGSAMHHGLFQVVAIQTTTGFCSADFDAWGFAAKSTLLVLMFIGGSAGSTGGGIKVMRILIAAKVMVAEIAQIYSPKVVRSVKVGRATVDPELRLDTLVYILGILVIFAVGTITLMAIEADGIDITTAATASAAMLNNIGPGLGGVGATRNYEWFSDLSKVIMSILMVVGRLEMFTIIVLFSPRFWFGR